MTNAATRAYQPNAFWRRLGSRPLRAMIGVAFTLLFLVLALSQTSFRTVAATLAKTDFIWILAAMGSYAVNLSLRGWRWQIILRSSRVLPYPAVVRLLLVGYGLNVILPARLGELARAEMLKNTAAVSRTEALASIVIERLFDGLAVISLLSVGLLLSPLHRDLQNLLTNLALTGGVAFGAIAVAILLTNHLPLARLTAKWRIAGRILAVQDYSAILRTRRGLLVAACTLLIYVPDTLTLWLIVKALGMGLGFSGTLVLAGAASLSTLLPSGPAFIGPLQFAYMLAIRFSGGSAALGVAAATLAQTCILLPVALLATVLLAFRFAWTAGFRAGGTSANLRSILPSLETDA